MARIAELPRPTWYLLLAAALDPTCSVKALRAAAAEVMGARVELADLQPAIDAQLVRQEVVGLVFRHPLLASAIAQHARLDERVRMHVALAGTFTMTRTGGSGTWPPRRSAKRRRGRRARRVGGRAARRGALAVSVAALDRAATLATGDDRRAELLSHASLYALEAGRGRLALELAGRAAKANLEVHDRARMLIVAREVSPGKRR